MEWNGIHCNPMVPSIPNGGIRENDGITMAVLDYNSILKDLLNSAWIQQECLTDFFDNLPDLFLI